MLNSLYETVSDVSQNYTECDFPKVYSSIVHFSTSELSSFYFDIAKHTLFNSAPDSCERRSTQTVFYHTLRYLVTMICPIAPHLSEEIFEQYKQLDHQADQYFSVFQYVAEKNLVAHLPKEWKNTYLARDFQVLRSLRVKVNGHIEDLRQKKGIGSSMEAHLSIHINKDSNLLQRYRTELSKFFIVASHQIVRKDNEPTMFAFGEKHDDVIYVSDIVISKSNMHKCIRCRAHVSEHAETLCAPCDRIIKNLQ